MVGPRPAVGGRGHSGKHLGGAGTDDREDGTGLDRGEIGLAILVLTDGHEGGEPCDGLGWRLRGRQGRLVAGRVQAHPSSATSNAPGATPAASARMRSTPSAPTRTRRIGGTDPGMVVGYLGQMAHGEVQPVDGRGLDEGGQG